MGIEERCDLRPMFQRGLSASGEATDSFRDTISQSVVHRALTQVKAVDETL